ncbi:MAG: DUF664 domain-containing protein [Ilumatobacteraceae bacterium]|nr:DUF664 domain-containing protein [Ilumatobacteraceae bacterium]
MDVSDLYLELYGRIPPLAEQAVDGLGPESLCAPPRPGANTVGWLIWHLARVQDHHISELMSVEQLWQRPGCAARFGLRPDPSNTGYGHSADDVLTVRPDSTDAVLEYLGEVDARTRGYLGTIDAAGLDRIVDDSWDPPVTLGVRLVSVADDCLQHVGQANYVRGLLVP